MTSPRQWALRLLAGVRLAVGFGLAAELDTRTSNVSPPTPIRGSGAILENGSVRGKGMCEFKLLDMA
jgi:hypothetical protein